MDKQIVGFQILGGVMMDWATIITSISAIGVVEGGFRIYDKIRFKGEEKREKKETVEQTAVATDQQQIDLGDLFLEKTQKWATIIEDSANKVVEANARRDDDWKELKADMVYVKAEVSSISEYLNGDYQNFKNNGGKRGKRK